MKRHLKSNDPRISGFSLVEILVASSIAAMVVGASVSMLGTIATNRANIEKNGLIELQPETAEDIGIPIPLAYQEGSGVTPQANDIAPWMRTIPFAPSIALSRNMELIRSELVEDISHAAAVFCVGRNSNKSFRNIEITLPFQNDARELAKPGRFEALLNVEYGTDIFVGYRGTAPVVSGKLTNYSIYVIGSQTSSLGDNPNVLRVLSLYEVDFVRTESPNPEGTYVYIKQWVQQRPLTSLVLGTDPIEFFYPKEVGMQEFYPPFVQFERLDRKKANEGESIDRFKIAPNKPFYFVWLPDPAAPLLEDPDLDPSKFVGLQGSYAGVSARTPYFFVIPMFPAL